MNNAKRALYDTLAFEKAVEVAATMTNESDTLLIVTADHSHVMTVSGYSDRGNDILGIYVFLYNIEIIKFYTILIGQEKDTEIGYRQNRNRTFSSSLPKSLTLKRLKMAVLFMREREREREREMYMPKSL